MIMFFWYSLILAQYSLLNFLTKSPPDAGAPLIIKKLQFNLLTNLDSFYIHTDNYQQP
ncbi:hypothetical protein PEC106568_10550 [Pectobacterium carotovorum subsp. carotovorum]|nr:hypothetical protein PEC106568_10550 [Pectobacterium carotovorum subsp. carotovorum]